MSQVNADTIRKSDGSLGTDIRVKNTSVYESDGGTSVTQNLVQALCKAWCRFDDGADSDSFNVSSVTDHTNGDYQVFIANDMANATYIATLMFGEYAGSGVLRIGNRDIATGSVGCVGTNGAMDSAQDVNRCGISVFGDLA